MPVKEIKIVADIPLKDLKKNWEKVEKDKVVLTLLKGGKGANSQLNDYVKLTEEVYKNDNGDLCAKDLDKQELILLAAS